MFDLANLANKARSLVCSTLSILRVLTQLDSGKLRTEKAIHSAFPMTLYCAKCTVDRGDIGTLTKCLSRGLLHECKTSHNLCKSSFEALLDKLTTKMFS